MNEIEHNATDTEYRPKLLCRSDLMKTLNSLFGNEFQVRQKDEHSFANEEK